MRWYVRPTCDDFLLMANSEDTQISGKRVGQQLLQKGIPARTVNTPSRAVRSIMSNSRPSRWRRTMAFLENCIQHASTTKIISRQTVGIRKKNSTQQLRVALVRPICVMSVAVGADFNSSDLVYCYTSQKKDKDIPITCNPFKTRSKRSSNSFVCSLSLSAFKEKRLAQLL